MAWAPSAASGASAVAVASKAAPEAVAGATAEAAAGATATVLLEVAMWSGAWGLLDALVDLLAPEDTGARLLLYLGLLVAARLSPWYQDHSALAQAGPPDAAVKVLGFLTAVALCSGSWGLVDVAVEKLTQCLGSGGSSLAPVLSYGGLVVATTIGVALHPRRAAILDSLSQVSWT